MGAARRKPRPPSSRAPTDRQKAFLAAVRRLLETTGKAPTAADVARELGITRKGARPQLQALEDKGYLEGVEITIRAGWRLTDAGEQHATDGD